MSSYTRFTTKITKIIVQSGIYILYMYLLDLESVNKKKIYTIQLQLGSIPPPPKKKKIVIKLKNT